MTHPVIENALKHIVAKYSACIGIDNTIRPLFLVQKTYFFNSQFVAFSVLFLVLGSYGPLFIPILLDAVLKHLQSTVIGEQIVESAEMFFYLEFAFLRVERNFIWLQQRLFSFFEHPHEVFENFLVRLGIFLVVESLLNFVQGRLNKVIIGKKRSFHDSLDLSVHEEYDILAAFCVNRVSFIYGFFKLDDSIVEHVQPVCVYRLGLSHLEVIRTCIAEWVATYTCEGVGVNLHEGAC